MSSKFAHASVVARLFLSNCRNPDVAAGSCINVFTAAKWNALLYSKRKMAPAELVQSGFDEAGIMNCW